MTANVRKLDTHLCDMEQPISQSRDSSRPMTAPILRFPRPHRFFCLTVSLVASLACSGGGEDPGSTSAGDGDVTSGANSTGGVDGTGTGGFAVGAGGGSSSGGSDLGSGAAPSTGGAPTGSGGNTGGASTGGVSSGGGGSGGSSSGGMSGSGGTPGGSSLADQYPCDGTETGYDAVISGSGSSWDVSGTGYGSLLAAARAALGSGGTSESDKLTVLLVDDGNVPANEQLRIFSNTVFNACGTITVVDPTGGSDQSPFYARNADHIDIPHMTVRGNAQYGLFFREVEDVHIGVADVRLAGGLGMRIDNNPSGNSWANSASNAARQSGYQLDDVYVENVSHGVEFYGISDITIGSVVARNTSQAGLMLNNSVDVEVGLVDGQGVSPNNGYAVFRMANDNGKNWDNGTHPMSVHVEKVIARESGGGDGQGIFCLTDSGGVTIDEIDLENTASSSIWLEWCTNVRIGNAATPSRIVNSGNFMISYGTSTRMSNQLVFENIAITGANVNFNHDCPPEIDWINVTRNGSPVTTCE